MKFESAPDFVKSADAHNIAASGTSVFDFSTSTPYDDSSTAEFIQESGEDKFGPDILYEPAKGIPAAVISGGVGIANSITGLLNLTLPADKEFQPIDTMEVMASLDSNLADYYAQHKTSVDFWGFAAGAIVPSTLAIKGLRAGQMAMRGAASGEIGTNTSLATRLLVPNTELQVKIHGAQLASRNATWKLLNGNTLKTVASGAHQGALEAAVAEAAILATSFKSPIFDNWDLGDFAINYAVGVGLGIPFGAVGGLGASYFGTKNLMRNAQAREWSMATKATTLLSSMEDLKSGRKLGDILDDNDGFLPTDLADDILRASDDITQVAKPVTYDDVLTAKKAQGESGYSISPDAVNEEVIFLNRQRDLNIEKLKNEMRTNIRALENSPNAKKDLEFGNLVADLYIHAPQESVASAFTRMREFMRLGESSSYERMVKKAMRTMRLSKEETELYLGSDPTRYIKLHSGLIGETLTDAPRNLRLADTLNKKDVTKIIAKELTKFKGSIENFAETGKNITGAALKRMEARWAASKHITAAKLEKFGTAEMPVYATDLPLMRALLQSDVQDRSFVVYKEINGVWEPHIVANKADLKQLYNNTQLELAYKLGRAGHASDVIEHITDLRADVLSGAARVPDNVETFYSAQDYHAATLSDKLGKEITPADLYTLPKYAKVTYAEDVIEEESGNILRGMQGIQYRQKVYAEATERAAAKYLKEWNARFVPITDSLLAKAWRGGVGQGFVRNAGGSFGSLEAAISQNANIVANAEKEILANLKQSLENEVQSLLRNREVAVKFSGLNEMLAGMTERFTLSSDEVGLIPVKLAKWEDEVQQSGNYGPKPALAKGTPEFIEIDSPELLAVVKKHMQLDFIRNGHKRNINSVFGPGNNTDYAFYPVRQDPRDYKHVAFVVDTSMAGVGHKRMLLARNAAELQEQIRLVPKEPSIKIVTDPQSQEFHKAVGDWMYDATLHDNYLDAELTSKGVRSNFFPMTDPQLIADTFLQHHIRKETALFREVLKVKFAKPIEVLERRGRLYANIAESSTDHVSKLQESSRNNPYMAMVKSLLNITRLEDIPGFWLSAQRALDENISKAWNAGVNAVWRNRKLTESKVIEATRNALGQLPVFHKEFSAFTNMGQALSFIATKSGNKFERVLATKMQETLKDVPFHVAESGVSIPGGFDPESARSFGTWFPEGGIHGRVVVKGASFGSKTAGITNRTVLHEALHAFLEAKRFVGESRLASDPAAISFSTRWEELRARFLAATEDYAHLVPAEWGPRYLIKEKSAELLTYGLTNPRLRKALEQMPGTTKGSTLGSEFVELATEALGLKKSDSNMLIDLLNTTEIGSNVRLTDKAADWYNSLESNYTLVDNIIAESDAAFGSIGFRSAYWGAAEQIFANTRIDRGVLSTFIRTANTFLTNTVLRWDPINTAINKISLPVIMMPEIKSLINAIKSGNEQAAGELSRLAEVVVPGSDGARILSPYKLIANAYKILHSDQAGPILQEFKKRGIVVDTLDQHYKGMDALTLTGHETAKDLQKKTIQLRQLLKDWGNIAAVATGNEWAERTNRAVAALVMKQLTDLGVKYGKLSEKESWAYINLFTNRVNGVIRAAERPLMFQGPIGQAMGLFQSYQFNLMQQAFRHIGEGNLKYAAMMAGLQGSIFGASSLPGFDLINDSLVGNAAGNKNHTDAYMVASDWVLYGMPSYFTSTALFTRGDVNPRTWTVVPNPTNPTELPIFSSIAKAVSSVKTAFGSWTEGAPAWDSFLLGLEHLGLSRPLSGLAVSLRGLTNDELRAHSTQKNAQFLYANDLMSITTLTRIAGAKPLDEAKMLNNFYRINAYASEDRRRRMDLGIAMKVSLGSGNVPDAETLGDFAAEYVARGGSPKRYNSYFMDQYKNANVSQAKQLSERLNSPYARNMQFLLGGTEGLTYLE
ncbi:hypothetical protein [Candidatus Macondimonas diazotrophica]|jgi:hypothetical protein|uniref:Large polyvalent protein associated domain-containing protein n=1 Tax=Candidatus Macondimonas diazotrophica TaxID=2305248 RepID=A0A4Z0F871_9GAMM|nr:hypothetical protein [Candidatus Macondimonas diazotrophica]TFZ81664.1 hypothetical protein E4680_11380 [Candidatus Macondimonas diazotrophica]